MGLDARGDASVAELIAYLPLMGISTLLIIKHGIRNIGWIYLLLLSFARVLGASTHIASELQSSPSSTLLTVTGIMESSGISPLLLATLGFIGTVCQITFDNDYQLHRVLRVMHVLCHVALGMTIVGGVIIGSNQAAPADNVDKINTAIKIRHIGVILFVVQWVLTAGVTGYVWRNVQLVLKHRRTMLKAITASVPFLAVRVLYSVLSSFAPTGITYPGIDTGDSSLSSFNSTKGKFGIYLIMSVIMEFIVVLIYVTAGLGTPLQSDYSRNATRSADEENIGLYPSVAYRPGEMSASSISLKANSNAPPMAFPKANTGTGY